MHIEAASFKNLAGIPSSTELFLIFRLYLFIYNSLYPGVTKFR